LWILGFITLCVFFQSADIGSRIGTIATLTLAYIAFLPTINSTIPATPYVKAVEILVYLQIMATILLLIQSLILATTVDISTYKFNYRNDGFFIASVIINLIVVVAVLSTFVVHKCLWEPRYTK
jgi:hypothetical protein